MSKTQKPRVARKDRKKSIGFAGIASLLAPGFGKFYLGKIKISISIFVAYNICALLLFFFIDNFQNFVISISIIGILYLSNIIHTLLLAQKLKNEKPFKPKWYTYAAFIFVYLIVVYEIRKPIIEKHFDISLASIPTVSMNPTLFPGDHIAYLKTTDFKNDDLMVYRGHIDTNERMAHRLAASPGDLIGLKDGRLFRNNEPLEEHYIRLRYFIKFKDLGLEESFLQEYDIVDAFELDSNKMMIHISPGNLALLKNDERIIDISVDPIGELDLAFHTDLFPNSSLATFSWTQGNYGPLRIPYQGWVIQLDSTNSDLYQSCILAESPNMEFKNHQILEDGIPILNYEFKTDYYFLLGDNRYNSFDSRYIGFVPKRKAIGKIIFRFWSLDWDKIGTEF